MSLTPRQAFKFGFLLRCADENLSDAEVQARVKYAMDRFTWDGQRALPIDRSVVLQALTDWEKQANVAGLLRGGVNLAKNLGWWGLMGGAGAGALGGYTAAKMTEEDIDPNEVKKQELIAAYKQQAERIRRQMLARSYRQPKAPRKPRLVA